MYKVVVNDSMGALPLSNRSYSMSTHRSMSKIQNTSRLPILNDPEIQKRANEKFEIDRASIRIQE
jgi:hypothetical protein